MANKLSQRFRELIDEAKVIESKRIRKNDEYTGESKEHVDEYAFLSWETKASHLIIAACGESSQHFTFFEKQRTGFYSTNLETLRSMIAVLLAAQEDFDGGYVNKVQVLVLADLFSSELEQASELLRSGFKAPAAVIAGVVLETSIRELCSRNDISHGKLDKMNADLAKAGIYNVVVQKRVTHLAAVRNAAAHGNADQFKDHDVKAMIEEVEQFLAIHL